MTIHSDDLMSTRFASRSLASASQLKSEEQILALLAPIYRDIGGDPAELVTVRPSYGGWLNAIRFCIVRSDDATTWVARVDIDTENRRRLIKALRTFSCEPNYAGTGGEARSAANEHIHSGINS
jgi:hypothetical protein